MHGWPSVLGGLASIVFVAIDSDAEFLTYSAGFQCLSQFLGVVSTIAVAVVSGYITGTIMKKSSDSTFDQYFDGIWWEGEYFEEDSKHLE